MVQNRVAQFSDNQYSTVLNSAVQSNAVNCSAVQRNAEYCSEVQFKPVKCSAVRCDFMEAEDRERQFSETLAMAVELGTCHNFTESSNTYSKLYRRSKVDKINRIILAFVSKYTQPFASNISKILFIPVH